MELLPLRDFVKDNLGNYYVVINKSSDKLILVNAVTYYSFNRILNEDFVKEMNTQYKDSVAVGQPFLDIVRNKIEGLMEGKYPGKVYLLESLQAEYDVVVDGLYEVKVTI